MTTETTEAYSPGEETFNRRRQAVGLVAGPLLALAILLMPTALAPAAQRVGAVLALMIVFWMTEALPLAVTALMGPTLCVMLGVATAQVAYAPFADPVIFLFIGSFILAEGMIAHRLDRRLAFTALASQWVGSSGLRLVVAYAGVTCFLSMWMSNTATTAMMFPLGLAVLSELGRERKGDSDFQRYAMAMMLVTSFAATIGGMGTPVGTPPNLIGVGLLRTTAGIDVSFTGWMMVGVPIVVVTMGSLVLWFLVPRSRGIQLGPDTVRTVSNELVRLGAMTRGERNVVFAFSVTVALWILPGIFSLAFGETHAATRRLALIGAPIETEAQLDVYCHRVAGTVGVVMATLLGATDPAAPRRASALGQAMQRTNILRDVDEDLASGRVYVARETLDRLCGGALPPPAGREALLRDQIARADALYDAGMAGIGLLPCGQRAIAAAGAMYREILRQIERDGYHAQAGRAIEASRRRKLLVAVRTPIPGRPA